MMARVRLISYFVELAGSRRGLLISHLILGTALLPIPIFCTLSAEWLFSAITSPSIGGPSVFIFLIFFPKLVWLLVLSVPIAFLFLIWSLPESRRLGLPIRDAAALSFLIFSYVMDLLRRGESPSAASGLDGSDRDGAFHTGLVLGNLDTVILLVLILWWVCRRRTARPVEKAWFHWLMFAFSSWYFCPFTEGYFNFFDSL